LLYLKTVVKAPTESKKQKSFKKLCFLSASLKPLKKRAGSGSGSGTQVEREEVLLPEGVHLRDCPAAGLDVYEETLHGSVRVVDRQVEVQLSKKDAYRIIFCDVSVHGPELETRELT
jgi:hypothetical protein